MIGAGATSTTVTDISDGYRVRADDGCETDDGICDALALSEDKCKHKRCGMANLWSERDVEIRIWRQQTRSWNSMKQAKSLWDRGRRL